MELQFGFLADYAGPGHQGKLILVGIFDTIFDRTGARPIPVPTCYLVASIEAPTMAGSQHAVAFRITDQDHQEVAPIFDLGEHVFRAQGPGRPLRARIILQLAGVTLPELGDYEVHVLVDGNQIGAIPLFVTPPPVTA